VNINKYIELLRFYVTDKIGQINQSVQDSLSNEIEEILSSILSAIFSLFISTEFIKADGLWGIIFKTVIVILSYCSLKYIIKKFRRYRKSNKEQKAADESNITKNEAKSLVDRFDHIACDGILLSRDYYQKYIDVEESELNEKLFYLFESFYYYKKALQIASLVTKYPKSCFSNANNLNGISMYRFINVFNSLSELKTKLIASIKKQENIEYHFEIQNDMSDTVKLLDEIERFIKQIQK